MTRPAERVAVFAHMFKETGHRVNWRCYHHVVIVKPSEFGSFRTIRGNAQRGMGLLQRLGCQGGFRKFKIAAFILEMITRPRFENYLQALFKAGAAVLAIYSKPLEMERDSAASNSH